MVLDEIAAYALSPELSKLAVYKQRAGGLFHDFVAGLWPHVLVCCSTYMSGCLIINVGVSVRACACARGRV